MRGLEGEGIGEREEEGRDRQPECGVGRSSTASNRCILSGESGGGNGDKVGVAVESVSGLENIRQGHLVCVSETFCPLVELRTGRCL